MFTSFLLSLREGVEAALVIGIVLGALRQLGRPDCARRVWSATGSALATCLVVALALRWLGWSLHGRAEPIFEGITLLVAASLLTWMLFWMKRQSRTAGINLPAEVRTAACVPGQRGVFALTFVAVAREGLELALFLTAASLDSSGTQIIAGTAAGLIGAALLGVLWFSSTARLNLRRFFRVTEVVMILFAAGMIAKAVHEFNEVGWIPAGVDPVWDTQAILPQHSPLGSILRTLLGYTPAPSLSVVIAYVSYLAGVVTALRVAAKRQAMRIVRPASVRGTWAQDGSVS